MDLITQAALGAVVGELVLGKKLGRRAIGWGALFGALPDADWFITVFLDTVWFLNLHRGFSHSILLTLILTFALAKPLAKRWKRQKVTPQRAGCFVFLAWSTHILIDCFNSYGTQALWPFSGHPVSFDNLFVIDLGFSLPLLVAVIWGLFIKTPQWKKGKGMRMVSICLTISCLYVGLSFWMKHLASSGIERDLAARGTSFERKMESPAPFSIFLWRCLIEREDEIWLGYRSVFDGDEPVTWTIFRKNEAALEKWSESFEVREVRRFSKDWCLARETDKGVWLVDMRFGMNREVDKRGLALRPRAMFSWEYQPEGRGDKLKKGDRQEVDFKEAVGALFRRTFGDREGESEPSRLIGNPATLSEPLGMVR